jgi:UDP-N-acetylglucosamine 2-epimerase (non-hydrolysing)
MSKPKCIHVVGARPNFMKVAPVLRALEDVGNFDQLLVHTGQHYDNNMSDIFFQQLEMPKPHFNLEVGSGSHTAQTAAIMTRFEEVVSKEQPSIVIVYGDVNSTVAASLVCAKMLIRIAHVEAGLRSNDRGMPEEINRIVTDQLADILFTPSDDADRNLMREGIPAHRIHMVGNVMIDTLVRLLPKAVMPANVDANRGYILVTLHRPSNVDNDESLKAIMDSIINLSERLLVIFPVHPRTRKRLTTLGLMPSNSRVCLLEPLGYMEFLALEANASVIITDSGGVQEESTYLGVPCLTLRDNTERPVTVDLGTNELLGSRFDLLSQRVDQIVSGSRKVGLIPPLWDGCASVRIAQILNSLSQRV